MEPTHRARNRHSGYAATGLTELGAAGPRASNSPHRNGALTDNCTAFSFGRLLTLNSLTHRSAAETGVFATFNDCPRRRRVL